MKVKKFQAESMPKAMKKVKQEMGTDAVILNSKEVKNGGFLGFFKKKGIEVIAAKDPDQRPVYKNESPQQPAKFSSPLETGDEKTDIKKELESLKELIRQEKLDGTTVRGAYSELKEQDLSPQAITDILERLTERKTLTDTVRNYFLEKSRDVPRPEEQKRKQFVHLIGPTGVGKTTTAAKLAADAVLNKGQSVGFITTDTYRIAAIEQIRTYAKLLDVPLEVAYNLSDYMDAREKLKDRDLIIVDTAGRNYKDPSYVRELEAIIDFSKDADTVLVLSMTSRYKDMEAVFRQFSSVPLQSVLFTKADESESYGGAVSLCTEHRIGVSHITKGQSVPDDMEEISIAGLIENMVKELADE